MPAVDSCKSSLPQNFANILFKQLSVKGFIVGYLEKDFADEFYADIPPKVASEQLKYLEYVKHGIESIPQTILDVQKGDNTGKAVVVVAQE